MTNFPTNIRLLDAATFQEEHEDVSIDGGETEGGYLISRPRFTRAPRRTWTFKFVEMRDADKQALQAHWTTVKGRSAAFNWTNPATAEVVQVRYGITSLKFSRSGFGPLNIWETDPIILNEV